MKKDNRGFTLTELLVCVVIFGVVLASIFGFMLASSKSYNKVNDRLDVQLQAQLAANQISEFAIDCNAGIAKTDTALYIINETTINETAPRKFSVNVFSFVEKDGEILYGKLDDVEMKDGVIKFTLTPKALLTDHITSFSVTEARGEGEAAGIKNLTLELGFEKRSARYTVSKTLALRNKPALFTITADGASPAK